MNEKTNWQVVQECREAAGTGNEEAWRLFLERFEPALRRGISRALRAAGVRYAYRQRLEDCLQDCYCKILKNDRRVLGCCRETDDRALFAFFLTLGERVARDALRRERAEKRGLDRLVPLDDRLAERTAADCRSTPERRALVRDDRRLLVARLRSAAAGRQQERNLRVLVMVFVGGLTSREISKRFGGALTPTSIDSLVYRVRRRLLEDGVELGPRSAAA